MTSEKRQDFQAVEHTQHTDFDNPEGNRSGVAGMNEDGPGERSQRCLISLLIEVEPDLEDWYNICLLTFSTKEGRLSTSKFLTQQDSDEEGLDGQSLENDPTSQDEKKSGGWWKQYQINNQM